MHVSRFLLVSVLCVVVLAGSVPASAQIKVFPPQAFITYPNRSTEVSVKNVSDRAIEVSTAFTYAIPVAHDTGKVDFAGAEAGQAPAADAASWMRTVPAKVVLEPQEARTFRVVAQPPAVLADGEYWSRLTFTARPSTAPRSNRPGGGIAPVLISEINIPVHFRRGAVSTGVGIEEFTSSVQGSTLGFLVRLSRSGSASFWGRLRLRVSNASGKVVETRSYPMVVYTRMEYKNVLDLTGLPSGSYTLDVTLDTQHPSLKRELQLSSQQVSRAVTFTIP